MPADVCDLDGDGDTTEPIPFDLDNQQRFLDDIDTIDTGNGTPPIVDMGAYEYGGPVIYVDANASPGGDGTSLATAYKYLQDALADPCLTSGYKIWVAEGTYKPDQGAGQDPNNREATFQLINGVEIYGGFPSGGGDWQSRNPSAYETILSGDINTPDVNTDNSYHVVTGSGTEPNAVLDGFTITSGNANGAGDYEYGGGMYNNSGSPMVSNCTFRDNSANNDGGGIDNYHSDPNIINCAFSGNEAGDVGGGMYNYQSDPNIINCAFSGNEAADDGGGMGNYESSPMVTSCTFSGNWAADDGGVIYNTTHSDPNIINCTFSENTATDKGGGIYNTATSEPNIANCILWGNSDSGGTDESAQIHGGDPNVTYSCIQDGDPDDGSIPFGGAANNNIDDDPLLADPNGPDALPGTGDENLRILGGSPCTDVGDNNAVPTDKGDIDNDGNTTEPIPWDIDGVLRFIDGDCNDISVVDMGACEYIPGDLNADLDIDWSDVDIIKDFFGDYVDAASDWGKGADFDRDGTVDLFDFALLGQNWMTNTYVPSF